MAAVTQNNRSTRTGKTEEIKELKEKFDKMTSMVMLDYKGMNVETVTKLRTAFRKAGVEYRVVKNTLVKQALKGTKLYDVLDKHLVGMTGLAWSYEDPSAAAKVLKDFKKDYEAPGAPQASPFVLRIRGGLIEGQVLDGKAVETQLATMPGKNELRATLLATLQAPLQNLVVLLAAPSQNFAYLLDSRRRDQEAAK